MTVFAGVAIGTAAIAVGVVLMFAIGALFDLLKLWIARRMGVPVDQDELWFWAVTASSLRTMAVWWASRRRT